MTNGAERETLTQELAAEGQKLAERERGVVDHEQHLVGRETELRRRFEDLAKLDLSLQQKQSQLNAAYALWEAEKTKLLADLESRESSLATRSKSLGILRRKLLRSRRRDLARVQSAIDTQAATRRRFLAIVKQLQARDDEMTEARRSIASETLGLERFRLECVGLLDDAAAAEKKIDRLRREEEDQLAQAYDELHRQREQILAETERIAESAETLDQQFAALAEREVELRDAQESLRLRHIAEREAIRLRNLEMRRLRLHYDQANRQVEFLKGEVERIAGAVFGSGDVTLTLMNPQAA